MITEVTYDLEVTYRIRRYGYKGGKENFRITEGYTTVHDIPRMIATRRSVRTDQVIIELIRENKK
jgi:hypothetical protein